MCWKEYPKEKPKKVGEYLCTVKDIFGGIYVATYEYNKDILSVDDTLRWYDYNSKQGRFERDDIIAWTEIPEPYKPEVEIDKIIEKCGWFLFQDDINHVEYWKYGENGKPKATIVINKKTKEFIITPTEKYEDIITLNQVLFDALCKKYKEIKEEK